MLAIDGCRLIVCLSVTGEEWISSTFSTLWGYRVVFTWYKMTSLLNVWNQLKSLAALKGKSTTNEALVMNEIFVDNLVSFMMRTLSSLE